MNAKRAVTVSKFLSKYLRHEPEALGLTLETGGWVEVGDLLTASQTAGFPITLDELREVVITSDKQRFALDDAGQKIRANQGHSAEVDLQLQASAPPALLFHGTAAQTLDLVLAEGLKRMRRHHVHLSSDRLTAAKVGGRHGKPVVLEVDAAGMAAAGHIFYLSANGVWLTDAVAPEFLRLADEDKHE